ncbi:MAG: hypothetical protein ACRDXX_07715 [Stackebrandtia sp.]
MTYPPQQSGNPYGQPADPSQHGYPPQGYPQQPEGYPQQHAGYAQQPPAPQGYPSQGYPQLGVAPIQGGPHSNPVNLVMFGMYALAGVQGVSIILAFFGASRLSSGVNIRFMFILLSLVLAVACAGTGFLVSQRNELARLVAPVAAGGAVFWSLSTIALTIDTGILVDFGDIPWNMWVAFLFALIGVAVAGFAIMQLNTPAFKEAFSQQHPGVRPF